MNGEGAKELSRRGALRALGGAGVVALIGCGGGAVGTSTSTGTGTGSASGASCVLTPEETVGPYFVDEKLNRSDLTTNTTDANVLNGIPLALTLTIMNYNGSVCSKLAGALVDLWQADAGGVYSDEASENTIGQTYLRGYQITDASGVVDFKTIIPGWYSGRTVHIHVMIRTTTTTGATAFEFTTQLFFDQTVIDAIFTTVPPYSARGVPDTTNGADNIYESATQLTLQTASGGGYTAAITLGVQT